MVMKGKTKELLIKQLKTCEKKMQELTDSIKRPNLRIMVQAKGMPNIFSKIITENLSQRKKQLLIAQEQFCVRGSLLPLPETLTNILVECSELLQR
jgi:CHAD domain-containing protein